MILLITISELIRSWLTSDFFIRREQWKIYVEEPKIWTLVIIFFTCVWKLINFSLNVTTKIIWILAPVHLHAFYFCNLFREQTQPFFTLLGIFSCQPTLSLQSFYKLFHPPKTTTVAILKGSHTELTVQSIPFLVTDLSLRFFLKPR